MVFSLFIAIGGVLLSVVVLSRMAGAPAEVQPLHKLTGLDFLIAGFLFIGSQILLSDFASSTIDAFNGEIPLWMSLFLSLIAGLITWAYLGWRAGSYMPRRQAVNSRKLLHTKDAFRCYFFSLPGLIGISIINYYLVEWISGVGPSQTVAIGIDGLKSWELLIAVLFVAGTQPWLEEVLFRGFLWRHLAGRVDFGPRRALLYSSFIFALAHEWQVFLPVFYLGITFGWIYWRSGKLRHAIAIHAFHNAAAFSLLAIPNELFSI